MVEVICDTSFLIHLATRRIKNISTLETEIGSLQFVLPDVVVNELQNLLKNEKKKHDIIAAIDYSQKLKKISISGKFADKELIEHVKQHGGIIGTMDKDLKKIIKKNRGSIISFSNDRIILES
ncbi:MAG TPA: PIN domain-containing protein [Nitrosopumilaceae archaeon]|nr:PIN domain-containing protein [Nitrosopumilaceae archaeon]